MEGSSRASGNGSRAESQKSQAQTIMELFKIVEQVQNDSEAILEVVSGKQTVMFRLTSEFITVSYKFIEFFRLWITRNYSISENIESFHKFMEIEEQAHALSRMLDEYADKFRQAGEIIGVFARDMKSHVETLQQYLEAVSQAHTLGDLAQVQIPTLEWIETIPNPEIEILADKWEEMQLGAGISHCLNLLRILLLQPEPEIGDELRNM